MQERVSGLGRQALARLRTVWHLNASGCMALVALSVSAAYYAGAQVGFLLRFPRSPLSIIWPPNAIVLVALLLVPTQRWWVVVLAVLPAHVLVAAQNGLPAWTVFGLYLTNCGEALLAAAGVRRFAAGPPWFASVRQVAIFIVCALVATFVFSFLDTAVVTLMDPDTSSIDWDRGQGYWLLWQERFVSNALTYLTVPPVLLIGAGEGWRWLRTAPRQRRLEAALMALSVLGAAYLIFRTPLGTAGNLPALLYVPVPVLLWAAFRFGVGGSSVALLGLTLLSATSQAGSAVFVARSPADGVLALQIFLIVVSVGTLLLAALDQERQQTARELHESEERYRMAVRHLPDGFATIFDADLRFLLADGPGLARPREQLEGKTIFDVFKPQTCTRLEPLMRAAIEGRRSASEEEFAGRWYHMQCLPLHSAGRPLGLSITFDVTERKRAEEALRASEARFRRLADSGMIGLTVGDSTGRIVEANAAFLAMVGYTPEDLAAGRLDWAAMTPPEYAPLRTKVVEQLRADRICGPYEKEYVRKDGSRVPVLICGAALGEISGAATTAIMFVLDLSERKRAQAALTELEVRREAEEALRESEARLQQANLELEQASRLKSEFLATMSHEFRTPLTLLLGPLQELLAAEPGGLVPEYRAQVEIAHRNGLRLLKLVNTLLDFSRLEAGRLQATYQPTDLAALSADLAGVFRSAIEHAGLRMVVDCPPLPEPVYVDRDKWEKIVFNLLSNALKFTFEGEIALSLGVDGEQVVLAVRDTGTGIAPEELPHLFDRFDRVRGARARTREGAGIGLALVQELAHLHGGSLGVTSTFGVGSTFTVAIPRGHAHLPADHIAAAADVRHASAVAAYVEEARHWSPDAPRPLPVRDELSARPGAKRPTRLLVVDDNADMRAYLVRVLRGRGVVEAVGDGGTALEVARTWAPDLILTDVMMPGLDGFALLQAVRADPHTRSIPVILLSARADDESRVEGLRAGADDYLVKPLSAVELLARVDGQLALVHLRGEARANEERQRLARDLHDSVAQSLYSLTLLAYGARRAFQSRQPMQVEENLDRLYEAAQQALREIRLLVYQLRPGALAQDGLIHALERRLDAVERRAGVAAQLVVEGDLALSAPVVEAFYYIAQEALTNTLKHAAATEVTVRLAHSGDTATLSVSDNGRGFDLAAVTAGGGLGLVSMRERAARMGASFAIESAHAGGTRVTVELRFRGEPVAIAARHRTASLAAGEGT